MENQYEVFLCETLEEELEKEIYDILKECDEDFCPPLSCRGGTNEKSLANAERNEEGILQYFQDVRAHSNVVLTCNGKAVAFMSFVRPYDCEELHPYQPLTYLTTLCIRHDFRGKGLSVVMYEKTMEFIKKKYPQDTITLRTWSTNKAQMHLMKRLEFQLVATLKDNRGPGVDTVYYIKK